MVKYVIKVTYLEGRHKGKEYFLDRCGYVIDNLDYVWQDSSYTLSSCKAVCTRKENINTAETIYERRQRESGELQKGNLLLNILYMNCAYMSLMQ